MECYSLTLHWNLELLCLSYQPLISIYNHNHFAWRSLLGWEWNSMLSWGTKSLLNYSSKCHYCLLAFEQLCTLSFYMYMYKIMVSVLYCYNDSLQLNEHLNKCTLITLSYVCCFISVNHIRFCYAYHCDKQKLKVWLWDQVWC